MFFSKGTIKKIYWFGIKNINLIFLYQHLHTPALKGGTQAQKHVQNSVLGILLVLGR